MGRSANRKKRSTKAAASRQLDSPRVLKDPSLPSFLEPDFVSSAFQYQPISPSVVPPPPLIVPTIDRTPLPPIDLTNSSIQRSEDDIAAESLLSLRKEDGESRFPLYQRIDALGGYPRNNGISRTTEECLQNYNALLTHIHSKANALEIDQGLVNTGVKIAWFEALNESSFIGWGKEALCWVVGWKLWRRLFPTEKFPPYFDTFPHIQFTEQHDEAQSKHPAKKIKHTHCTHEHERRHHHHHHHHRHDKYQQTPVTNSCSTPSPPTKTINSTLDAKFYVPESDQQLPTTTPNTTHEQGRTGANREKREQNVSTPIQGTDLPSLSTLNLPRPPLPHDFQPQKLHPNKSCPVQPAHPHPTILKIPPPTPLTALPDLPTLIWHKVFLLGHVSMEEYDVTMRRCMEILEHREEIRGNHVLGSLEVCEMVWRHYFPDEKWPFGYVPGGGKTWSG